MQQHDTFYLLTPNAHTNPLLDVGLKSDVPHWAIAAIIVVLFGAMVFSSWTDLFCGKIIPNTVSQGSILLGAILCPFLFDNWATHYFIAAGVLLVFGGLSIATGGIGFGDVKLWVGLTLFLGAAGPYLIIFSMVLGVIVGLPLSRVHVAGMKYQMAMIPPTTVAAIALLAQLHVYSWAIAGLLIVVMVGGIALLELLARGLAPWLRPPPIPELDTMPAKASSRQD